MNICTLGMEISHVILGNEDHIETEVSAQHILCPPKENKQPLHAREVPNACSVKIWEKAFNVRDPFVAKFVVPPTKNSYYP